MSSSVFTTTNPYTEETLLQYPILTSAELDKLLQKSDEAFHYWRNQSLDFRKQKILKLAEVVENNKKRLSEMATREMGKPLKQAYAEVDKCILLFRYYAEEGEKYLKDHVVNDKSQNYRSVYESLGVILGIMPWNFPYWQAFRFAVPTLMVGNSVMLKHSSNTLGSAVLIEEMFKEAGFPDAVYTNIIVDHDVTEKLISDSRIKGVSLTGSTRAGKTIGELAGKNLKRSVLELGGSDPYIVLPDADLEVAVEKCSQSRMINNGQSCVAAKRFIIHKSLFDSFLEKMKHNFSKLKMGDPMDEATELGPLARKDLRDGLLKQVSEALEQGAKTQMDVAKPNSGFFAAPQILTNIKRDTKTFNEEFFGPVALLFSFEKEAEAFEIANGTIYGLGGAIFSKDVEKAQALARKSIQSGFVAVNDMVRSDPRLAFGGVKSSGYGRELGPFGLHEFTNVKTLNF